MDARSHVLPCRGWQLLAVALLAVGSVAVAAVGGRAADEAKTTVTLIVDYGDGVEKHFSQIAATPGMTVLQVLEAAQKHPRGIKLVYRGRGETAFLTQIDDLANEGRGKNWTYRVNGELPPRSFALCEVRAGDTILWRFGDYR